MVYAALFRLWRSSLLNDENYCRNCCRMYARKVLKSINKSSEDIKSVVGVHFAFRISWMNSSQSTLSSMQTHFHPIIRKFSHWLDENVAIPMHICSYFSYDFRSTHNRWHLEHEAKCLHWQTKAIQDFWRNRLEIFVLFWHKGSLVAQPQVHIFSLRKYLKPFLCKRCSVCVCLFSPTLLQSACDLSTNCQYIDVMFSHLGNAFMFNI